MRRYRAESCLIVTLFVLGSCAWLLHPYKEPHAKPRETEARSIVKGVYKGTLGDKVDSAKVRVYWSDALCPYPAEDGTYKTAVVFDRKCYAGLTFIGGHCKVAWRGSFSSSAYAHELLHAYLNATGHGGEQIDLPDGDPKLCGWCRELEREANRRLVAAGL